jgi:SapC protein
LLESVERDQVATDRAVAVLADAQLIKPWPLTVNVGNQQMTVNGLYCVDESALNVLDDASFLRLLRVGRIVPSSQRQRIRSPCCFAHFGCLLLKEGQSREHSHLCQGEKMPIGNEQR